MSFLAVGEKEHIDWKQKKKKASPFKAATSWDQLYVNIGNKFVFDTTDRILTQIRDLIEIDEVKWFYFDWKLFIWWVIFEMDIWRSKIVNLVERTLAFTVIGTQKKES